MALRTLATRADDLVFVPESGRSQTARLLDDFLYRPLTGISAIFSTYANFRYIQDLNSTK
jgi:hypothetical protein